MFSLYHSNSARRIIELQFQADLLPSTKTKMPESIPNTGSVEARKEMRTKAQ